MLRKNVSGQYLYFGLASVASGLPITSGAGGVSGRKSFDGGSQALLSGSITEIGGGQYVAKLFDFDTNGNYVGYLFTASGAAMVSMSVLTDGATSGGYFLASGSVNSGVFCSGQFVTVPIASISGVQPISGTFVSVPVSTLSGVVINSGAFVTVPAATLSGIVANSGLTVSLSSGTVYPASGVIGNAVLTHSFSGYDQSGQRCLLNAGRKLVNTFDLSAFSGRLATYKEDGTTLAYLQDVATVSGASPITQIKGG